MPPKFASPALILANGDPPPKNLVKRLSKKIYLVICTDGAYLKALNLGLKPGWVIGDMDSLPKHQKIGKEARVVYDHDQNCTDLEKTIKFLIKFGCRKALILGAIGDRLDHSFAAFQIMEKYADRIHLKLIHEGWSAEIISKNMHFSSFPGRLVSLFPLGKIRISTRGLQYSLRKEWMSPGSRGVSNLPTAKTVTLRIHKGHVLLIRSIDPTGRGPNVGDLLQP
ncbi:MAG: thiamine diphosphokinase [Elusimicrobia bacterium]|nr:thiamine diphosphokinase [Elusimicrobiota bacterium]